MSGWVRLWLVYLELIADADVDSDKPEPTLFLSRVGANCSMIEATRGKKNSLTAIDHHLTG